MAQLSYPGVYVEEISSGVHTITGVATSIAAFLGRTTKGPVDRAVRCLSLADFRRNFADGHPQSDLGESVRLFYANGGTDCYIVRLGGPGSAAAGVTLRALDSTNVLTATAKTPGGWGNGVRLEVSYNTPQPDEAFALTVIVEDAGKEVAREQHAGLSMNPASPRFAPDFITASSDLVDLALHTDAASGGANDLTVLANSFPGFSQSRVFSTAPIGAFRTAVEASFAAGGGIAINVDDTQWDEIDLSTVFGTAAPAIINGSPWTVPNLAARLAAVINPQLSAAGTSVTVAVQTAGNFIALRITSATAEKRSVRIRRAAGADLAVPLMLGLDQGGIEPTRYSDFRPTPTAAVYHDVDGVLTLAQVTRDALTSVSVDGAPPVALAFTDLSPAATDPWLLDSTGHADGVREKLRRVVDLYNQGNQPWKAELWGYHLAFLARAGSINTQPASVVSAPDTSLGGAAVTRNVRRYAFGNIGTGPFQPGPGPVGVDPGAPTLTELQGDPVKHSGLFALDLVDLFNLMVIPADEGIPAATHLNFWGPASGYCAQRRAFLLIDPPPNWVSAGVPAVVNTPNLLDDLRARVVKDYSAVFFPAVKSIRKGLPKRIGPCGLIAGLMARIDSTRGVWKAPAGIEADLRGIVDLDLVLTDLENGVLNKRGVNCLRRFPSGFVNWGARTLFGADDDSSEWKYIPIRRFALFLEESLFRGTKWVVFEPNDEPLWAKIRLNLNAFMMSLFRQGAFQGSTPDKAFYVKCDAETTTQNDRNLGIVNIEVGFAPLKPAEFVVIKIQQIAGDLV